MSGNIKDLSGKSIHDICKNFSNIRQIYHNEWKQKSNSPDEIFEKFVSIAYSSPENKNAWGITLWYLFLKLPSRWTLRWNGKSFFSDSRPHQPLVKNYRLKSLQQVWDDSVSAYKHIKDISDLVIRITNQQHFTCSKIQNSIHYYTLVEEPTRRLTNSVLLYGNYQSEQTYVRYKSITDPADTINVSVRKVSSD